VINEDLKAVI